MIRVRTPDGNKNFILRGILLTTGRKGIAQGRALTPQGDIKFWDGALGTLPVSISPTYAHGAVASEVPVTINTASATASASGGSEPYSYSWSLPPDATGWTILGGNTRTAVFQCASVEPGQSFSTTPTCTVTDARGATGSASITAAAINYGGLYEQI